MANGYETPAEDAADTMPEGPAEDAGEGQGKISQQQANYRESDRTKCCGLCQYFTGSAGPGAYQCTKVAGEISPYGYSDEYQQQANPFRGAVPAAPSLAAMSAPPAQPPMPPPAAPPPATMIGGKMYQ